MIWKIHKILRENPPKGVSPEYIDAFFERNGPALEKILEKVREKIRVHRRPVVPTAMNISALRDELRKSPDGIIREVPPTSAPHLRRIIQAGWLEEVPGQKKRWRLSETGRRGLADALPDAHARRFIAPLDADRRVVDPLPAPAAFSGPESAQARLRFS